MKKNLLTLSLIASVFTYAQDTYIGSNAVVKVQPNTLFYNGGNVTLSPASNEVVKNEGNILVKGDFKNNSSNTTKGKEFINVWTNPNSYGQLIIADTKTSTGLVALERSLPNVTSIDEYIIALPFTGKAEDVYKTLTNLNLSNNIVNPTFSGWCAENSACPDRYTQSLMVWDNSETEYDNVKRDSEISPIKRYLLNSRSGSDFRNVVNTIKTNLPQTATQKLSFSGVPSNEDISIELYSGLKGNSQAYENETFSQWKNRINNHLETYDSYLSNQQNSMDNSRSFGKNIHRLANPFTSNLDLSDISRTNSWIYFSDVSTNTPTAVYDNLIRFRIFKLANDFSITWNSNNGNTSTSTNTTSFSAYLNSNTAGTYFWTGSAEALLIKPYETFFIDYYAVNRSENGGTRTIKADVTLGDKQKTFIKEYAGATSTNEVPGTYSRNNNVQALLNDEDLKARGLVTDFDFTQLELYLSENSSIKGNAAYLLNANFMTTGNETATKLADNNIFFYEETENGEVILDAETISNSFNSEDYIGKPIRLGFKNLNIGSEYQLNVNLYEYSILNKVQNLNLGRYYLLDKLNNTVKEVDALTQINFTADDNINNRFEFYWNESPRTLSTNDLSKSATYIYKNNSNQLIRFEDNNTTAKVEIFDVTGRLINVKNNVNTNIDHKLNLSNVPNIYVVVITYENGKVVTKKTINK
ncbi:T9SS type A sorting domain-containing protein [Faecalibacter bovis]|uniref:T9SS type A sorting domain-containing protein n=1 Tax=Faecalibacter bovis TaxID=2898187 RepID=A0ABX7XDT6_9FLAO|nr:T9SS type A sorting domain-containing protein [Faecalibacter bovis]QTV06091.1 T9SS type A sorting domain-containing protein [Faecalibacter bovis]